MRLTEENRATLNEFLVREGFTAIAENFGADVNQAINDGTTPLWIATEEGQLAVARLLLDSGADVNKADMHGRTPLFMVAARGQLDEAKLLIERGAKVNQATTNGETPLYVAAELGQLNVVELLLKRGADVNQATTNGATPFFIAAQNGHIEIANLIKEQIIRQILLKIDPNSACCISYEVIAEDGTIGGERAYSTGGQHLYKKTLIEEWLRIRGAQASDPMTRHTFSANNFIDVTDEIKRVLAKQKAAKARLLTAASPQEDQSHVARLAKQRAQEEEARERQPKRSKRGA